MARCFIINNSFIITFLFSYSNLCACVCLVCAPASTQRQRQRQTISTSMHGFHDTKRNRKRLTKLCRVEQTALARIYLYTIETIVARWMKTEAEREQAKYWWAHVQSFSICVCARAHAYSSQTHELYWLVRVPVFSDQIMQNESIATFCTSFNSRSFTEFIVVRR